MTTIATPIVASYDTATSQTRKIALAVALAPDLRRRSTVPHHASHAFRAPLQGDPRSLDGLRRELEHAHWLVPREDVDARLRRMPPRSAPGPHPGELSA